MKDSENRPPPKPYRVGLTGGIASGKSTVADLFAGLGIPVIDTDIIAREVVAPGQPALKEIRDEFDQRVIDDHGRLNRAEMRQIVFTDDDARRRLERIVHPRIRTATYEQSDAVGGVYQLIVVPLLAESPLRDYVDRVLVVDCDEDTQIRRLMARDAESEGQARRILAAQASRDERLGIADDVLSNDGDLGETREQVQSLHQRYVDLAQAHR